MKRPRDHLEGAACAIMLGGGEPGCQALRTLETMKRFRKFINVEYVWIDWLNNSQHRFYHFYGETDLEKDPRLCPSKRTIKLIRSLPRSKQNRGKPIVITGRVLEQIRMIECAQRLGFSDEQIIKQRFDGELLFELVSKRPEINLIVVAAFGGKIPKKVIDLIAKRGGKVVICHPTVAIDNERVRVLPRGKQYRGAHVFEAVVNSRESASLQVVLLEAGDEWDSGRILATRHVFFGPEFTHDEMRKSNLPNRVQRLVTIVAAEIGDTLRYRLLPLLFTVDELLVGGYGKIKLLRMGISGKAVDAALRRQQVRRAKNGA